MKNILLLFAFLVCCINISLSQQNDTLLAIMRSVNIDNNKKIVMQSDIKQLSEITIQKNKNIFSLKKGSYTFVDSIGIEVNDKNKIIAISFLYGYDSNYVSERVYFHEQKKYKKLFNQDGKNYEFKSAEKSICVTRWEDKSTIFELIETIFNNKLMVYSRVFDKPLYYAKFDKNGILKKEDNSIELLRILGSL